MFAQLVSKIFNLCGPDSPMSQTDGQMTCDRKTVLCIIVHHVVIINGTEFKKVEIIKDLAVCYDSYLLFDKHINDKIAKAYGTLGQIEMFY